MSAAVFACMRNEGPFLMEWVAYHRVIGFDRVLVATNDCTDGSDRLLDALAAGGALTHLPHSPPAGSPPQDSGMRAALAHLGTAPADWLLHIDADEFLNLRSDSALPDLLALGAQAHVIALPWRAFGDSGHQHWPGATLPHFTRCEAAPNPGTTKFKSLFRPAIFAHAHDHMPMAPRIADPRVVAANGAALDPAPLLSSRHHSRYHPLDISLAPGLAVINHYAIRSTDTYLLRAQRGDGQGKDAAEKYRRGGRWHRIANRNEAEDDSILRHWPATRAELARLRALPGVADAEAATLADFTARLEALR
ncbi:glycosyltransferase family 2 protein [Gemmobacter sp.]|uniref:glycosyltransferase family 2 protein n=1 Tax=Gemmobacter sp. TaxID=1898957 RepID=UPI002AFE6D66|nr:glycosyltransferase family 2 protein [Gemmobacter sp.]